MEETNTKELILENGHKVIVETSSRNQFGGETSTFVSLNTGSALFKESHSMI
jgi:hypothetical protein